MKSVGIMIRKKTNNIILDNEIITLHSKLKKNDTVVTHYTTEKYYTKINCSTPLISTKTSPK
tara:strand:- start:65 stop:250 length:186 start_codon:yes stop_codon:yes gene_type:complete